MGSSSRRRSDSSAHSTTNRTTHNRLTESAARANSRPTVERGTSRARAGRAGRVSQRSTLHVAPKHSNTPRENYSDRRAAGERKNSHSGARDPRVQYTLRPSSQPRGGGGSSFRSEVPRESRVRRDDRARRQAQQRRVAIQRAILGTVGLLAFVGLIAGALHSSAFTIKTVTVDGEVYLTDESIVACAQVPTGTPLFSVDTGAIEERLRKNPWISDVRVRRSLPSTVHIIVTERTPIALVDDGEIFWYVDETGLLMSESELETSSTLPVIRDIPSLEATTGLSPDKEELANAITALMDISDDLKKIVVEVSARSIDETTLITKSGTEILVGDATDQLSQKSVIALSILEQQGENVVRIDVRSVTHPTSHQISD